MSVLGTDQALLAGEVEIVWEEDPRGLDYVRVRVDTYPHRRRIRTWSGAGRRVGYSVLRPDAPPEWGYAGWAGFMRREFFLLEHDRDTDPTGVYRTGCPAEGVDPLTVWAGALGVVSARAWGTRLPTVEDFLRDLFEDPPA